MICGCGTESVVQQTCITHGQGEETQVCLNHTAIEECSKETSDCVVSSHKKASNGGK